MARSLARRGWRTTQPDAVGVGLMLRAAGFVGTDSDPSAVTASVDVEGQLRRVHARYAGGWSCTLLRSRDGSYSLSQCRRTRDGSYSLSQCRRTRVMVTA